MRRKAKVQTNKLHFALLKTNMGNAVLDKNILNINPKRHLVGMVVKQNMKSKILKTFWFSFHFPSSFWFKLIVSGEAKSFSDRPYLISTKNQKIYWFFHKKIYLDIWKEQNENIFYKVTQQIQNAWKINKLKQYS